MKDKESGDCDADPSFPAQDGDQVADHSQEENGGNITQANGHEQLNAHSRTTGNQESEEDPPELQEYWSLEKDLESIEQLLNQVDQRTDNLQHEIQSLLTDIKSQRQ